MTRQTKSWHHMQACLRLVNALLWYQLLAVAMLVKSLYIAVTLSSPAKEHYTSVTVHIKKKIRRFNT